MTSGAPKREALAEAGSDEGGLYGLTPALLRAGRDTLDRDDDTRLRELIAPLHAAGIGAFQAHIVIGAAGPVKIPPGHPVDAPDDAGFRPQQEGAAWLRRQAAPKALSG